MRKATRSEITVTVTHGSQTAYRSGCRCDSCKKANTEYMRRYRKSLQEKAS